MGFGEKMDKRRKDEIYHMAIEAINSMGSRFFKVTITLNTPEEADYAANLWKSFRSFNSLNVTYHR